MMACHLKNLRLAVHMLLIMIAIISSAIFIFFLSHFSHSQSYFYKKENLLSGLIFNKENITIRQEYETVLRFYGYDLDGSSTMQTEAQGMINVTEATDMSSTTTSSSSQNDMNAVGEKEDSPTTETVAATETPQSDEAEENTATTIEASETDENEEEVENEETTTVAPIRKRRGRLGRGLKSKYRREKKQSSAGMKSPTVTRLSRSYYVLLDEDYENEFLLDVLPSPTPLPSFPTPTATSHQPSSTENPISTSVSPSVGKYRQSNHKDLFENVNSDTIEHIFYLNEHETIHVPYKLYDTVMKYAYVESLHASFLEIDLDSEYYNLIVIIPEHHDGLSHLIPKLKLQSLRHIRSTRMEYYWVKTIVPKFNLKGNTILTNDLQNVSFNFRFSIPLCLSPYNF
jgi:Serpin (serine protease inhibitor)